MKGTYILAISLEKDTNIEIGALGTISFKKGYYYYVGSAMASIGSTTLVNRVKRHLASPDNKKVHWHIDYFLNHNFSAIIGVYLIPSNQKLECIIASELNNSSESYIRGFGCSDCNCSSHLAYSDSFSTIKQILSS